MKPKQIFIVGMILLIVLGLFLSLGILSSRKMLMGLLKEEAHSFLTMVAQAQENSIFAEGRLEEEVIDKLISVCDYIQTTNPNKSQLERLRQSFTLYSIVVFDAQKKKIITKSGNPMGILKDIFKLEENLVFKYYTFAGRKYLRFAYKIGNRIYQIEASLEDITKFSKEYGINKILSEILQNPLVQYLTLQDKKGIIFATPNIKTLSRIEEDSVLANALEKKTELSRMTKFGGETILELVRPFIVDNEIYGVFRIGISLKTYYRHIRETERQLFILFLILFATGFSLFFFLIRFQSYTTLKELFSKTLGAIDEGVILVNPKGIITGINKKFCTLSGYDEEILLNHNYNSIFNEDSFQINNVLVQKTRSEKEISKFNKSILFTTYPLIDERNRVSGTISILRDMTRIREFEKEREERERLEFLGNLVANFAHEIRNPLNGLSIATQRLAREFPLDDKEYNQLTQTIITEIKSLNKTLNDFLSLARPRIKEKIKFNLSNLIQDILRLVEEQAQKRNVLIRKKIAQNVKISGNPDDLKRAILNILLNALDAVESRTGMIKIDLIRQRENVVLKIADNGMGMDKDEIARIFTPYFTTKRGGTGLGLYIAQQVLKAHQATLSVKSKKGKGTTFKIILRMHLSNSAPNVS